MSEFQAEIEQLRAILDHLRNPWDLDEHPWAESLLIREQQGASPGEKLARAVRRIFRELMPAHPPRKGKRLDTRWGAFGILASQYFAPVDFGTTAPETQREAWLGIDQAILLYVFGQEAEIPIEQQKHYCLVGNEPGIAPNSTLSGWNRKGLEALLRLVIQYEEGLKAGKKVLLLEDEQQRDSDDLALVEIISNEIYLHSGIDNVITASPNKSFGNKIRSRLALIFTVAALSLLLWAGWQSYQIYQQLELVKQDLSSLKPYLSPIPQVGQIPEVATRVSGLRDDLGKFQKMSEPFMWATPYLSWIPTYGGDISQAPQLLDLATGLVVAADEGLQAMLPIVGTVLDNQQSLDLLLVLNQLQTGQPRLLAAQLALAQAQQARTRIKSELLSGRTRSLVTEQVDPLLDAVQGKFRMDDALMLVKAAPNLLGVGKSGPKTYLLLIQNEDELRPTGGFITAVGSIVIRDGKLWDINVESSDLVDDFSKPYPIAPWQLSDIMNLSLLAFRDSNWFSDYPATAAMAEYLYSYSRAHSVDGVIAINQSVVVELLKTLGPVKVIGVQFEISSENVMQYMRSAKKEEPAGVIGVWDRKQFIGRLAQPILEKILAARGETLSALSQTLISLLDQRFILIQMDDPEITAFLAKRKWDGAIKPPGESDFLLVVDSNVGYNKTNAVVVKALTYEIDLSSPDKPLSRLLVSQNNSASGSAPCFVYPERANIDTAYSINECYWSYLRVYTPENTLLISATPHAVPALQTLTEKPFPARVDDLGNEDIPGVKVFGTFLVVPEGLTFQTEFQFELPVFVLQQSPDGKWTYRLTVQRQAGTKPLPLSLRLLLPAGATLTNSSNGFSKDQDAWVYNTAVSQDQIFEISFTFKN